MVQKLNEKAFALSFAIVSTLGMLILWFLGNLGLYLGAVEMMEQWHMFFSLSFEGIIIGMIESAVMSFVAGWLFAWVYNKFV